MNGRPSLTVAEREAIYVDKLRGKRLDDLAEELSCSGTCARKWWRVGRDQGLAGLRRSRQPRDQTGALSRFDPLDAARALYWKQQHPKRGPTRILVDLQRDPLLEGIVLPHPQALAYFFRQTCPELLRQRRSPSPSCPTMAAICASTLAGG